MNEYVTETQLWAAWAAPRGLYDPTDKTLNELVRDHRATLDRHVDLTRQANLLQDTDTRDAASARALHDIEAARHDLAGRRALIEIALQDQGAAIDWWVDGPHPDIRDAHGRIIQPAHPATNVPDHPPDAARPVPDPSEERGPNRQRLGEVADVGADHQVEVVDSRTPTRSPTCLAAQRARGRDRGW